jgi:hypothetical protein
LPLAHAFLGLFQHVLQPAFLQQLFERCRGRSYEKELDFPTLVRVVGDAITGQGSIHGALEATKTNQPLPVSQRAFYGKLGRIPLSLSLAVLQEATERLRVLWPAQVPSPLPACFDRFQVLIVDGKKSKNVAKRLGVCRLQPGRVLGTKLLVCLDARSRLVLASAGDLDGERNDNPLVPALLDRLRPQQPAVYVCDAQFCDLVQLERVVGRAASFVFRYHPKTHFHPDANRPARTWTDEQGRQLREEWGFLGAERDRRRRYVRRVTWLRASATHKDLSIVTNLTNSTLLPAAALLDLYLQRWKIETVFQEVAQVFGLQQLVAGTPEASAFETMLCMLVYNMLQLLKAELATEQQVSVDDISSAKLFKSVRRALTALYELLSPEQIVASLAAPSDSAATAVWLRGLLAGQWREMWLKARNKNPRCYGPKPTGSGAHTSIERLRRDHKGTGP